jgi:NADPH:quinone reductase-like Zn-dependent oxidoreductase
MPGVIPGCDGAGEVKAVRRSVRSLRSGDRVIMYITPSIVESNGGDARRNDRLSVMLC